MPKYKLSHGKRVMKQTAKGLGLDPDSAAYGYEFGRTELLNAMERTRPVNRTLYGELTKQRCKREVWGFVDLLLSLPNMVDGLGASTAIKSLAELYLLEYDQRD